MVFQSVRLAAPTMVAAPIWKLFLECLTGSISALQRLVFTCHMNCCSGKELPGDSKKGTANWNPAT